LGGQRSAPTALARDVIAVLERTDTTCEVRLAAIGALSRMGEAGRAYAGKMAGLLKHWDRDSDSSVLVALCEALSVMGDAGSAHAGGVAGLIAYSWSTWDRVLGGHSQDEADAAQQQVRCAACHSICCMGKPGAQAAAGMHACCANWFVLLHKSFQAEHC
jgi:hypothetical protein